VKQGFLYKRSGRDKWREKYVELRGEEGVLAYYPSLAAYLEDLHRKEVRLHCVTVKVPGQKPTGLSSVVEENVVAVAGSTMMTSSSMLSSSSFSSSVSAVGGALSPRGGVSAAAVAACGNAAATASPVLAEFQIVSVNGRTWSFGCESPADRDSWLQVSPTHCSWLVPPVLHVIWCQTSSQHRVPCTLHICLVIVCIP
jgi:hypothetical protein